MKRRYWRKEKSGRDEVYRGDYVLARWMDQRVILACWVKGKNTKGKKGKRKEKRKKQNKKVNRNIFSGLLYRPLSI
jgi:hypothetical protein